MFIDMHMHEMTYSKDSFLQLDEIVQIAKQKGLGAVCITDHDSMGLKEYAAEYSQKTGFPVFVGIEFFSLQGDIVAFGIDEYPGERIPAQEFIDLVKKQNGVCFAAHPFRNNKRGLEENLRTVTGLDGIEVLNGSTSVEACQKAARYAMELGYYTIGSSDCHVPEKSAYVRRGSRRKCVRWKNSCLLFAEERCGRHIMQTARIMFWRYKSMEEACLV